jgi:hypothetical protein
MANFNNQFATQKLRQEMSMTGTGATFTPGPGEQTAPRATKKVVRKKVKKEGKAIPSDWTDAPSIPNRPSKGGFLYKQLYENTLEQRPINEALEVGDRVKVVYGNEFYGETGTIDDIVRGFVSVEIDGDGGVYSMHSSDVEKIEDEEQDDDEDNYDWFTNSNINESYSKFKTETKTRSKPDQFHQAIREVKKKVQQINKMYEYVSRLKTELSEGEDGLKYKMHTEKALNKIKEMVSELNYKIKRFK